MFRVIILAAGKGKRMGSADRPKVLQTVFGKPMLEYVLHSVFESGVDARPVVVVGYMAEAVREKCGDACEYAEQTELKGTGDAVRCTRATLEGSAEHVMVLLGDQPLVTASTIRRVADTHLAAGATLTLGTVVVEDFQEWRTSFADFGRIIRDNEGCVSKIVEIKDASSEQLLIKELNPSYYCFKAEWLWKNLECLTADNAAGEYYLTDLLYKAISTGENVKTVAIPPEEALGVNTAEQLAVVEELMESRSR